MTKEGKKIYFLTPTDEIGASSRYRVYQFIPCFKNIECEIYPFMNKETYQSFKSGKMKSVLFKMPLLLGRRWKQIFQIPKKSVVFVHRDIIPFGPMILEKILRLKKCQIILDLDDAVYCNEIEEISSKKNRFLYKLKYGKRFDHAIKNASCVICGNQYIEKHCQSLNTNTMIIPTLIDTDLIKFQSKNFHHKELVIGWIGNPGNTNYIYNILKQVDIPRKTPIKFVLIGARKFDTSIFQHINIEFYNWSLESEYEILRKCDIGVMPLNDSEWSRGKCGLKLLQYMAVGIPGLASAVGVNQEIIQEGKNGWIVKDNDWNQAIDIIIQNQKHLKEMSSFCREYVEKNYSIHRYITTYDHLFQKYLKEASK